MDATPPHESDLLDGARRLDRYALETIYDLYYPKIYRYVYFRLGEAETSKRASAQVFEAFLATIQKKRTPTQDLDAWMYAQAAHLVDKLSKDKPVRASPSLVSHLANRPSDSGALDEDWLVESQISLVQQALFGISNDKQHYLSIRFTTWRSLGEIAELIGKPIRSMRKLQYRALVSLGRAFGGFE